MLERPPNSVPLLEERMSELLGHESIPACSAKGAHHNHRLPWRAFEVQFRNFPSGGVVLRRVCGGAWVAHVDLECAVLEAGESPAVLVAAFVRRPDGTHPLCREGRELLEKAIVPGPPARDTEHPAPAARDSRRTMLACRRLA